MKISGDDVNRFCAARGVTATCPYCGKDNWTVTAPQHPNGTPYGDWALIGNPDTPNNQFGQPTLPLLTLVCTNCYGVRTHALLAVQRWLKDNPAQPEIGNAV
jgi:hypothetical protein